MKLLMVLLEVVINGFYQRNKKNKDPNFVKKFSQLNKKIDETVKKEINADMFDKTNVHNEFQGSLRYGYPEDKDMISRVDKDFNIAVGDARFNKSIAVTHCNEFPNFNQDALYLSNNPYSVFKK